MIIRDATQADLPGILAIYNEVIVNTTAVYALAPVTLEERTHWLETRQARGFPVLVAVEGDSVLGFASYGDWRGAAGYKFTVEHSVHILDVLRGRGIGQQLMHRLILKAQGAGLHVMIGGIDSTNTASIKFHERLGFTSVAHFHEVSFKFNRWLDLVFMQRFIERD
ncbi:MAG: N-acetyltransferase family protein [Alphaproteobacteria bacterium]